MANPILPYSVSQHSIFKSTHCHFDFILVQKKGTYFFARRSHIFLCKLPQDVLHQTNNLDSKPDSKNANQFKFLLFGNEQPLRAAQQRTPNCNIDSLLEFVAFQPPESSHKCLTVWLAPPSLSSTHYSIPLLLNSIPKYLAIQFVVFFQYFVFDLHHQLTSKTFSNRESSTHKRHILGG